MMLAAALFVSLKNRQLIMYKDYLKIQKSKTGLGVFTTTIIPSGVPILEFRGELFTTQNLKHPNSQTLQIGPDTHLGPSGDLDDYINHSCNPNCKLHIIGNRAILYSRFIIPINNEITFDYSTSSTCSPQEWSMECHCGAPYCRKIISGFDNLPENIKQEYMKQKMVPLYISLSHMFVGK